MHRCAHCHPGQRPSPPGVSGGWSPGCARGAGSGGATGARPATDAPPRRAGPPSRGSAQRERGAGQRVERGGRVDQLPAGLQRSPDDQGLHVDLDVVQGCAGGRQFAVCHRPDAEVTDQAGHLHAAAGRQIAYKPMIGNIPVDDPLRAGRHGVDDVGTVLLGRTQSGPAGFLDEAIDVMVVRVRGADVEVVPARGQVTTDQGGALAEPGPVFAGVMTGLAVEVTGEIHQLGPHPLVAALVDFVPAQLTSGHRSHAGPVPLVHDSPDTVQQILTAMAERGEPGRVIDPGAIEGQLVIGDLQLVGQQPGRVLDTVT